MGDHPTSKQYPCRSEGYGFVRAFPDDGRVLALLPAGGETEPAHDHATLVLNFFDELERLHPRPGSRQREGEWLVSLFVADRFRHSHSIAAGG